MTEADLKNIESTFGVRLPAIYRNWALRLPAPYDESDSIDFNIHFFTDPAVIIEANHHARAEGWAPNHFCIGDQDANYFFIDLDDPATDVYYAQHDGEPYYDVETHQIEQCRVSTAAEFFTDEYRTSHQAPPQTAPPVTSVAPAPPARSEGFRRIFLGSMFVLAAVGALLYFTAEPSDLDLTRKSKLQECPVHHSALIVARAPIAYETATRMGDYFRAAQASFPYASSIVLASNYNSDEWPTRYRYARVWQCPDCVRAERRWMDSQTKPR